MRVLFVAATLVCAVTSLARAQAPDTTARTIPPVHDSFLGLDKPKHFLMSAFVESVSFASLQASGATRRPALLGSVGITAAIGLGREIHDGRTKGLFSFADLAWDALGAGAAAVMLRHTYR